MALPRSTLRSLPNWLTRAWLQRSRPALARGSTDLGDRYAILPAVAWSRLLVEAAYGDPNAISDEAFRQTRNVDTTPTHPSLRTITSCNWDDQHGWGSPALTLRHVDWLRSTLIASDHAVAAGSTLIGPDALRFAAHFYWVAALKPHRLLIQTSRRWGSQGMPLRFKPQVCCERTTLGNLGAYQTMTTLAKRVGGPRNLVVDRSRRRGCRLPSVRSGSQEGHRSDQEPEGIGRYQKAGASGSRRTATAAAACSFVSAMSTGLLRATVTRSSLRCWATSTIPTVSPAISSGQSPTSRRTTTAASSAQLPACLDA